MNIKKLLRTDILFRGTLYGKDSSLFKPATVMRTGLNLYLPYRCAGARVEHIADDFSEVRVRIDLTMKNRNVVGTIFGGSLYTATDPIFMAMFMNRLGKDYIVWDKAATIRFIKPGRSTLRGVFTVSDQQTEDIRRELATRRSVEHTYTVDLADDRGVVHASVDKVLYFRKK